VLHDCSFSVAAVYNEYPTAIYSFRQQLPASLTAVERNRNAFGIAG